ncbi:hypothetical protein AMATHDRAFT_135852 [Amanita thiersii Skay4041]|uniref:Cupredoxin n=1 Tax=Amanita thiersii Skay4041 TaxID=703135 RepID=A0A2A9P0R4_9AGAR|nr:hypothetical protein AMATHDRAFT_135852 [Amanita thiersii Skay4041]
MSPKFHPAFLFCGLLAAVSVSAKTFNVAVGDNNGLVFNPTSITGAVAGDQVVFTFMSKNHSATQSTFDNPCAPGGDGLNSGFQAVPQNSTQAFQWKITLDATSASKPLWFYCAQTVPVNHCHTGMVFAVNPTPDKSFDAFKVRVKTLVSFD